MTRIRRLEPEFVEQFPEDPKSGIIYISGSFATALHLCCCGCARQVITPFSPTRWQLVFDGETATLLGSIGNWGFPCESHYFIIRSEIHWAEGWTREQLDAALTGRLIPPLREPGAPVPTAPIGNGRYRRLQAWLRRRRPW